MSALYFDARIDGSKLQKDIANINTQISKMSNHAKKEGKEMEAVAGRLGTALTAMFSVYAAGQFVKNVAKVRGEFQQLEVAFNTMLGSKQKADMLMSQVVDFASRTPFKLSEVASGAKQLLAYNIAAEEIIPTLKSMGDVAAGLSVPIERLILNYGQVKTQLKLTGRELRDFNVAGVPVVAELAKNLNVAEEAIADMVSQGKIGFADIEKAFRTMTDEGGRFNNLMDQQAKTITGLISNFGDKWDEMLNNIGKQNQGAIADSIKMATTLVTNYEKIVDTLKILVATYGSYKAAVIATAVAQQAHRWMDTIRLVVMFRKEMGLATAAQQAFNVSAKANPYGLILAALAALVSSIVIFSKKQQEASAISQEFVSNLTAEKKAVDDLFKSAQDVKQPYENRKKAIDAINSQYGKYLENLVTEKSSLEDLKKAQDDVNQAMAQNMAAKSMESQLSSIREEVASQEKALSEVFANVVNKIKLTPEQQGELSAVIQKGLIDPESLRQKLRETLEGFGAEITTFGVERGAISASKVTELEFAIQKVVNARRDEQQAVKDTKTAYDSYLEAIGITGGGSEPTTILSINESIKETERLLQEAKNRLNELRAGDADTDIPAIQETEETIKNLEQKLQTLTGITQKINQENRKAAEEQLKGIIELESQRIDLERRLQASKIAIMKDGYEKQMKEADLAFQHEIDLIEEQKAKYEEAWKASLGSGKASDQEQAKYDADMLAFDTLEEDAEEKKNQKIKEINRAAAQEVKAIWNEVTDVFLNDTEREIKSINEKYDALINRAKEAGETDFKAMDQARQQEINESYINADLQRLGFQEQVEMQRAEIATQGYNREVEIERKKLDIVKDTAKKKIEVLKRSTLDTAKQDIKLLELLIDSSNEGLKELNQRSLAESVSQVTEMAGIFQQFIGSIGEADSELYGMVGTAKTFGTAIAKIIGGDPIGGVTTILGGFINEIAKSEEQAKQAQIELNRRAERYNEILKKRIDLLVDAGYIEPLEGAERSVEVIQQELTSAMDQLDDFIHQFLGDNGAVAYSFSDMLETVYGAGWDASELFDAMEDLDAFGEKFAEIMNLTVYKYHPLSNLSWIDKNAFNEAVNEIFALEEEAKKVVEDAMNRIGVTSANELAESLAEAFIAGEDAAEAWGNKVDDIIKNVLIKQLAAELLTKPIQEAISILTTDLRDGFDVADAEKFRDAIKEISETTAPAFDFAVNELERIGIKLREGTPTEAIKGSFSGITEETGSLIAGQFFAFRELQHKVYVIALDQLAAINQSVGHLAKIEENTGTANTRLADIDEKIGTLNEYIKKAI